MNNISFDIYNLLYISRKTLQSNRKTKSVKNFLCQNASEIIQDSSEIVKKMRQYANKQ